MVEISIVLPTFNGEKFIRESIDSVINQTFKEWELIVADDGSFDSTRQIVEEYAHRDSRIKVIYNEINKNLPASLNIGFSKAKGKFLTWTSDDNIYLKDALKKMYLYLKGHSDKVMVCSGMLHIDKKKCILSEHPQYSSSNMYMYDMVGASFLYKNCVLADVGNYDVDMFCAEDYDYWIRIMRTYGENCIGYLDDILYLYREQPNSLTSTKMEKIESQTRKIHLKYLDWIMKGIDHNIDFLMKLYNELVMEDKIEELDCRDYFLNKLPLLYYESDKYSLENLIFGGAGYYGKKVIKETGVKPLFFVDTNENIINTEVEGILVHSLTDCIETCLGNKEIYIVLTVGYDKQYEMMKQLIDNGIYCFCVYSRLLKVKK